MHASLLNWKKGFDSSMAYFFEESKMRDRDGTAPSIEKALEGRIFLTVDEADEYRNEEIGGSRL